MRRPLGVQDIFFHKARHRSSIGKEKGGGEMAVDGPQVSLPSHREPSGGQRHRGRLTSFRGGASLQAGPMDPLPLRAQGTWLAAGLCQAACP